MLANSRLRHRLAEEADARGVELFLPSPALCTDNGAMIAAAAAFRYGTGTRSGWDTDVDPGMRLGAGPVPLRAPASPQQEAPRPPARRRWGTTASTPLLRVLCSGIRTHRLLTPTGGVA